MSSRRLRIRLQPRVLRWARERAGMEQQGLAHKVQVKPEAVAEWERSGSITIAQADKLAQRTHTPLGYLYLKEPPDERLPIPDFRTIGNESPRHPSPDLLETVYLMQRRQSWMRDELIEYGSEPLDFVGACEPDSSPRQVAVAMGDTLRLAPDWASREPSWTAALSSLRDRVEIAGVLVVFNGIVGNNTHRKLNRKEFQGFALIDDYAPVVFVNGADFKAAQMFTLAHELAHIFVGQAGVSGFRFFQPSDHHTEQLCDRAAAEFLAPADRLSDFWPTATRDADPYQAIARRFKVSSLVAARRALDLKLINRDAFFRFYNACMERERTVSQPSESSGNFWSTQRWRIGKDFGAAVVRAVKEGRLPYREACRLTGLSADSLAAMPEKMGIEL